MARPKREGVRLTWEAVAELCGCTPSELRERAARPKWWGAGAGNAWPPSVLVSAAGVFCAADGEECAAAANRTGPVPDTGPVVTYEMIADLCGCVPNAVYQCAGEKKGRQHLDIDSLESVVLFVTAHGRPALRREIAGFAAQVLVDEGRSGALHARGGKPRSDLGETG